MKQRLGGTNETLLEYRANIQGAIGRNMKIITEHVGGDDGGDDEPEKSVAGSSVEFDQSVMLSEHSVRDKITYGELSDILDNLHTNYDEASCITVKRGYGKHALHHREHEDLVDVRS